MIVILGCEACEDAIDAFKLQSGDALTSQRTR